MPNSSQSSFIPKNNLPNRQKVGRRYNFFFVSLVVYGLFIATPIASAAVFIYEKHTQNVLNQTTRDLDSAIKSFSESDLLTVVKFDKRLVASSEVLSNNVPVNSVLQFFLQNAPQTVFFTELNLKTTDDQMVEVSAKVGSDSFDNVLFYRDEILRNPVFSASGVSNVTYKGEGENQDQTESGDTDSAEQDSKLTYEVSFTVPVSFFTNQDNIGNEQPVVEDDRLNANQTEDLLEDNDNNQ